MDRYSISWSNIMAHNDEGEYVKYKDALQAIAAARADALREAADRADAFFDGWSAYPGAKAKALRAAILQDTVQWPRKTDTQWISVKDRLPEKDGQYLVSGPHDVELACWNEYYKVWDHADGDDYWHNATDWFTHWMPLPKPPAILADKQEGK